MYMYIYIYIYAYVYVYVNKSIHAYQVNPHLESGIRAQSRSIVGQSVSIP